MGHITKTDRQTDRGEGCERRCAERREEKSGAKTHRREHINNNNTTNTTQKMRETYNKQIKPQTQVSSSMIHTEKIIKEEQLK